MEYDTIRSYEVSVWTLQDEFITVLKPSNLENKGQIEEGRIELNIDGTQNISFRVPMYLEPNVVNPVWYDIKNDALIVNMCKIKVVFNKNTTDEKVFEFLITNIDEIHQNDELYCEVSGEGLAFHELGKRGYKISLSQDDYENDEDEVPIANIQYWLSKLKLLPLPTVASEIQPQTWYYELKMDWSSFGTSLDSDKIYDEEHATWAYDNTNDQPYIVSVQAPQEKSRLIDISESNIYNITQQLAEVFGVFCRYEYEHDQNYHITCRKIVFYNKFYSEQLGFLDFTYPYSAEEIKRTIDSNDLVTKLYVKNVEDSTTVSGLVTILDSDINKSREDYILNFDYLHEIKTITDEQYARVTEFENFMCKYNNIIDPIDKQLMLLKSQLPDLEAQLTVAQNAKQLDRERISDAYELRDNLTGADQVLHHTAANPDTAILFQDNSKSDTRYYYVKISELGVISDTVRIYRNLNYKDQVLDAEILGGTPQYDDCGNLIRINNLFYDSRVDSSKTVYLTYDYKPSLYYDNIAEVWSKRLWMDEKTIDSLTVKIATLNGQIEGLENEKAAKVIAKEQEIIDFEKEMGAAIREGYWQPENYTDYGNRLSDSIRLDISPLNGTIAGKTPYASFIWDTEPLIGEQLNYYKLGVNEEQIFYQLTS